MRLKRIVALCLGLASLAVSSACTMQRAFTYPLSPIETINTAPPKARIAVVPANDLRATENRFGTYFVYLIPLAPFGWMTYERPEAARMFNTIREFNATLTEDIPKAMAQHMQRAGYATEVFFDFGAQASSADYVLKCDIRKTRYTGKIYSYLLSVYGPLLWIFGLPAGSSDLDLWLDLKLIDNRGGTVWAQALQATAGSTQGLYYNWGRDMEGLAKSLQTGLHQTLRQNPLPSNPAP